VLETNELRRFCTSAKSAQFYELKSPGPTDDLLDLSRPFHYN